MLVAIERIRLNRRRGAGWLAEPKLVGAKGPRFVSDGTH